MTLVALDRVCGKIVNEGTEWAILEVLRPDFYDNKDDVEELKLRVEYFDKIFAAMLEIGGEHFIADVAAKLYRNVEVRK